MYGNGANSPAAMPKLGYVNPDSRLVVRVIAEGYSSLIKQKNRYGHLVEVLWKDGDDGKRAGSEEDPFTRRFLWQASFSHTNDRVRKQMIYHPAEYSNIYSTGTNHIVQC